MNPDILAYIRTQRFAGTSDETIAQNLRITGWPEDIIAQALKTPHEATPQAPVPNASFRSAQQLLTDAVALVRLKLTALILLGAIASAPSIVGNFSEQLVELAAGNGATLILFIIALILLVIIVSIFGVISTIGIATILIHRDREVSFQEAFMTGLRKFAPFAWILFLSGFIEMGGFLLLFIPGLIFTIWFSFSYFVYLVEGVTGMNALLRSREYVRGYAFPILMRFSFLGVINLLISLVFGFATAFIPSEPIRNILGIILSLGLTPISIAFALLMYEDLRAIKGSVEHQVSKRNKMIYLGVACLGFIIVLVGIGWGIIQLFSTFQKAFSSQNSSLTDVLELTDDAKKRNDIRLIQLALSQHAKAEQTYPSSLELLSPDYILIVPQDPDGGSYEYELIPGADDYRLCATYTEKGRVCITSTTTPAL